MRAMPRSGVAVALLLLLIAACGTPSSAGDVEEPAPRGDGQPARLALTARGIRQLPASTPMTQEALSRALPGYTVELVPEDEYTEEHFAVKAGEERMLEIRFSGDETHRKLSFVDVVSSKVETDIGVAVGASYAEANKALGKLTCSDGGQESDSREALVVCTSPARKNMVFEFIDADEDGTPRRPASEVLDDAAGMGAITLVTITWSAR
jgi:hypothetical protein